MRYPEADILLSGIASLGVVTQELKILAKTPKEPMDGRDFEAKRYQ
jgi:hypothetical protein